MVIETIQNGTKPTSLCFLDRCIFGKHLGQDQRLADFTVRGIDFENRADELSPWPAQSTLCKHNVTAFSGHAGATYELLQNRYDGSFAHTVFAGYSLSALFLLYALTLQTKQKCAGYILISPSVWYEGFDSYFLERVAAGAVKNEKLLFIWGKNEGGGKELLQDLPRKAEKIAGALKAGNDVTSTIFEGDHHDYIKEKIGCALDWFVRNY